MPFKRILRSLLFTIPDGLETWLAKPRQRWLVPGAIIGILALSYILQNISAYYRVQLPTYDFGIFSQVLWKISYLQPPGISINAQPHWLGDHFEPSLILLAPFARILGVAATLLISEPLILCLGGIPLYMLGIKYTRSHIATLTVLIAYLTAVPTVAALRYTFHASTLVPAGILFALWLLDRKKWLGLGIVTLISLGLKENVGYYFGFLGIWAALAYHKKPYVIAGLLLAFVSLGWSTVATHYFIPFFKQQPFLSIWQLDPRLGSSLSDLIGFSLLHPISLARIALDTSLKQNVVGNYLQSFGYMPLLYPFFLPALPAFAERLISNNSNFSQIYWHYGAPLMGIVSFMALRGVGILRYVMEKVAIRTHKRASLVPFNFLALLFALFVGSSLAHAARANNMLPITFRSQISALRQPVVADRRAALAVIPDGAPVAGQDSYAAHLPHRNVLVLLSGPVNPNSGWTYLILDPSVSYWPMPDTSTIREIIQKAMADGYSPIYSKGTIIVLELRAPDAKKVGLDSPMQAFLENGTL